jgi:hypothetical protein
MSLPLPSPSSTGTNLLVCQIKLRSLQSIRLSTSTDDCIVWWLYSCAFRPRKASKVEKPSSRGVSSLHRWSLMLLPVLWLMPLRSLHTCMCVYYSVSTQLYVASTLLLLLRSWDPWLRRTSRPQCGYILTSLNKRTNRIGDLTRHRVSWWSPLMVPLRVHMLSIGYQNYQIQKIKVINKTGHPAYWTRHNETLNCQPT